MTYVVLARRWRPQRFADLVGQEHVARTLANAIESNRVAHAFLFTGVRGVGKTTSARLLAKALNCIGDPDDPTDRPTGPRPEPCLKCAACIEIALGTDLDVREIDGASYNGVDEVRKLQDSLPYRPARDRYKIIIVDEVHMLSQSAWNAFLKTLEEPPAHVKFIFATTEAHKVPVTILSRVQRFDFKMIPAQLIASRLRHVLGVEKIPYDEVAVSVLAREAAGSMRDAMSLLDQVIAWSDTNLTGENVARVLGVASRQALHDLASNLCAGNAQRCLEIIAELSNQGYDTAHVARDLLGLLRDLVVAKVCNDSASLLDVSDVERRDIVELAGSTPADDLIRLHQGFSSGFDSITRSGQPRAALEMLLVRLARRPPLLAIDDLLARLGALERRLGTAGGSGSGGPLGAPKAGGGMPRASAPAPARSDRAESAAPQPPAPVRVTPEALRTTTQARAREGQSPAARQPAASSNDIDPLGSPKLTLGSPKLTPASAKLNGVAAAGAPPQEPPLSFSEDEVPEEVRAEPTLLAWHQLLARLNDSRPELAAFLAHAVPLELGEQLIVIGWEQSSLFAQQASDKSAVEGIQRAAEGQWGTRPDIRFESNSSKVVGVRTLATIYRLARERKVARALERARNHPAVLEAINILGARLKDVRLRPE